MRTGTSESADSVDATSKATVAQFAFIYIDTDLELIGHFKSIGTGLTLFISAAANVTTRNIYTCSIIAVAEFAFIYIDTN